MDYIKAEIVETQNENTPYEIHIVIVDSNHALKPNLIFTYKYNAMKHLFGLNPFTFIIGQKVVTESELHYINIKKFGIIPMLLPIKEDNSFDVVANKPIIVAFHKKTLARKFFDHCSIGIAHKLDKFLIKGLS